MNEELELTQEQIDVLTSHLEDQDITEVELFKVLKKLPDSQYGEGEVNPEFGCHCVLCGDEFESRDEVGERFGKFVHIECAKEENPDLEVKESV